MLRSFLLIFAFLATPLASADQCQLFPEITQDSSSMVYPVSMIEAKWMSCKSHLTGEIRIGTRNLVIGGNHHVLLVDPYSMKTVIEKDMCWLCSEVAPETFQSTRYQTAIQRLTKSVDGQFARAGLRRSENSLSGVIVTADLCPSAKKMDRDFIEHLISSARTVPIPIAFALSGKWLKAHPVDFQYLKSKVQARSLDVTWVNHSLTHPYHSGLPDKENFLRSAGVKMANEILENERLMIENGITPSVFFRFPGLISDQKLLSYLQSHGLIPIDADAWLAKGEIPHEGSVILIHANGNEPKGLKEFSKLWNEARLPTPLEPLTSAPRK